MAYPFDDEEFQGLGAIPPDLFMQGGQGPSMGGMVPGFSMGAPQEPVMGEESFYQPPQLQGLPDDFFARLAQTQGPSPFNFQPRQGRGARGIDVILAALQGFGNARTAQGAQRTQQVQQGNEAAKSAAREMANWRWRQAQERRAVEQHRDNIARSKEATAAAAARTDKNIAAQGERQDKSIAAMNDRQEKSLAASEARTQKMVEARTTGRPPRRLNASENEALADYNVILSQINDVKEHFRPDLVGPVRGRLGGVGQAVGAKLAPGESKLRGTLAAIRNTILKLRSGAAITPQEATRLLQEIATVENAPQDFEDKLSQVERFIRIKAQTHRDNLEAGDADLSKYRALPSERDYRYRSGAGTTGGAGVQPSGSPGQNVRMRDPKGRTVSVPPADVARLKALGAVEI